LSNYSCGATSLSAFDASTNGFGTYDASGYGDGCDTKAEQNDMGLCQCLSPTKRPRGEVSGREQPVAIIPPTAIINAVAGINTPISTIDSQNARTPMTGPAHQE
jgi:hypothetical protein